AEEVEAAIWQHCTAEIDGLRVLAWSTDVGGEAAIYDDPEGSLGLLPTFGFCDADDPVWRNTIELLRSDRNPFWLGGRRHPGLASRKHPDRASLTALCVDLLGPRRDAAIECLLSLRLDGEIACGWYDPDSGEPAAERFHGGVAGLLAWTLWTALEGCAAWRVGVGRRERRGVAVRGARGRVSGEPAGRGACTHRPPDPIDTEAEWRAH